MNSPKFDDQFVDRHKYCKDKQDILLKENIDGKPIPTIVTNIDLTKPP